MQYNDINNNQQANTQDKVTFSLFQNANFHFQDAGREIIATGTIFTGKEQVFVNGNKISNKRNMKFSSTHDFVIEEDKYEIEFKMVNFLANEIDCILIKNGTHLKTLKFQPLKKPLVVCQIILAPLLIGMAIGSVVLGVAFLLAGAK